MVLATNKQRSLFCAGMCFLATFFFASMASLHAAATSAPKINFKKDIQPIFVGRCQVCHGSQMQMNGLRLDRRDDALKGGYGGVVITPGESAASKLIQMVTGQIEGKMMPPTGEQLAEKEIDLLRAWIDQGAEWPETAAGRSTTSDSSRSSHWAFRQLQEPKTPRVSNLAWVRNEIDRFILSKLESKSINPSPEAGRVTLIRRLSLDLTGLPPTPDEVVAFIADNAEVAYEALVDRLLDSPHYGEQWGRHWLDLARYGDSHGFRGDQFRPHAWRYRHWVINSLNADIPFDQFTVEQIAGDLIPGRKDEQWVATGFHRNTPTNTEGGSDPEEWRFEQVVNRTNTVSTVWLGITAGCAQCHDHKYDPLTQKEYYRLFAFFNDAEEINIDAPLAGERGPYLRALPKYQAERQHLLDEHSIPERQAVWEEKLRYHAKNPGKANNWDVTFDELRTFVDLGEKILFTPAEFRSQKWEKRITDHFVSDYHQVVGKEEWKNLGFSKLKEKLKELDTSLPPFSEAQAIHTERIPRKSYVFLRGSFKEPGIEVAPGTPAWLHPMKTERRATRLDLARWLISSENVVTPRVTVNRIWQQLFGRGIVTTSENFGSQGSQPSHPALLDWLAKRFRDDPSFKRMIKTVVMSAAYRQSSRIREDVAELDPQNLLTARQHRFRLTAELIRDSTLAVSGLLYPEIGGRSVRPPQPAGALRMGTMGNSRWMVSEGHSRYRRGMYIQYQRMAPYPLLTNFDMPTGYEAACRRERSNTALQALNLLNDPVFIEAAQALAFRVITTEKDPTERLRHAFKLCLARNPDPIEIDWMQTSLQEQRLILKADPGRARKLFPVEVAGLTPEEGAVWVSMSSVLLNLDEFLTRE
jgi:cytochrome c553